MNADATALRSPFESLSKGAYLDVLLPKSSDFNASTLIRDVSPEELARAVSRRYLFFDEEVNIVLVLRTAADADTVHNLLPSLEIVLAAHATDAVPQGSGNAASASGKHDLASRAISAAEGAEVVAARDQTYVIWKPTLDLTRPRARLQRPAIYFTANLGMRGKDGTTSSKPEKVYLKPFEPLPRNILGALNSAPEFRGKQVYLSEDKVTKVATPKAFRREETVRPIRGATKRAFPTMPALFTRIRYTTVAEAVIASLHVETSQTIAGTVDIEHIDFHMPGLQSEPESAVAEDNEHRGMQTPPTTVQGTVQCLSDAPLPLQNKAGDESVFLYCLPRGFQVNATVVTIRIRATVILEHESQVKLDISWQSQVDLKQPATESMYAWSPSVNTSSLHQVQSSDQSASASGPPGGSSTARRGNAGVTTFFSAPETTHQYDDFLLTVKCINRSAQSRRIAIMSLRPEQSRFLTQLQFDPGDAGLVAGIFGMPPLDRQKSPGIFCHTPDVKMGPILPGASFEAPIELRAMTTGVLDFGTFIVLDLDTQRAVNVTDLPDVTAYEALEGSRPHGPSKFAMKADAHRRIDTNGTGEAGAHRLCDRLWMSSPRSR